MTEISTPENTAATTTRPIRVLVADDDPLVRSALTTMLTSHDRMSVVATAENGAQACKAVDSHHPDIVLMDIRMPTLDGLAATELLFTRPNPPKIIILTTFNADEYVLRALKAGASGFLLKDCSPEELLRAVDSVAAGHAMLSPAITRQLLTHVSDPARAERGTQARDALARLSDRERDIALAVGKGMSNAEIATGFSLSLATVKTHVSSLLRKLDVANRVEIALLIRDAELI